MLSRSVADRTADNYQRTWQRFTAFCTAAQRDPLPAAPATVACYVGTLLRRGTIAPSSLGNYLTPINTRHAAAGLERSDVGRLMQPIRIGYARLTAEADGALPHTRRPLPAPVMWRVVELALATPDLAWRVRFAALVAAFVVARRTVEVLELELCDVSIRPDGGIHIEVRFYEGAERRFCLERLVYDVPPTPDPRPDLPLRVFRRLLLDLSVQRAPPMRLLFAPPGYTRAPTLDDINL